MANSNTLLTRFGSSERLELQEISNWALLTKGDVLIDLDRPQEAIASCDAIAERFGSSDRFELLENVALALNKKAFFLREMERYESALEACEQALRLRPEHVSALALRTLLLIELRREDDGFESFSEFLRVVPRGDQRRAHVLNDLIDDLVRRQSALRRVIERLGDDHRALADGLVQWVRQHLPKTKREAEDLEERERVLQEVFGSIPEAKSALDMLEAARLRALGDEKAMFKLPLELRRLVEEAIKGSQEGNGE